jgi:Flp pilus assembly protein TadB
MEAWNSPFIVPLGAFAVAIVAIISGMFSGAHSRRLKAEQRMALIARGVPLSEIEAYFAGDKTNEETPALSPMGRLARSRRTALILASVGFGIIAFGIVLTVIVHEREVFTVAATGLIPLALGMGFWQDYRMQQKDLERLGVVTRPDA